VTDHVELPMLAQGHAPAIDGCHKTHSGVPTHVLPGCVCAGPSVMVDIKDKAGNKIGEHEVKVPNHVNVSDNHGTMRNISLDQARTAGYIV